MVKLAAVVVAASAWVISSLAEVSVPVSGDSQIALSTRGPSSFRVRFLYAARGDGEPIDTPMVQPDGHDADFQEFHDERGHGINASFGSVLITPEGALKLIDEAGNIITSSQPLAPDPKPDMCSSQAADIDSGARAGAPRTVTNEGDCCNACKETSNCKNWIFGHPGNAEGNCWLMSSVDGIHPSRTRTLGAGAGTVVVLSSRGGKLYGGGGGPGDDKTLIKQGVSAMVENRMTYVPQYYSTDGYAALGVVNTTIGNDKPNFFPADYKVTGQSISWTFKGPFELYLMPAPTLDLGTKSYYELIGSPLVPPRYGFGFMVSRWGWKNRTYIETTLERFRSDNYPIDAFITDFGWFTNVSDYDFSPAGESWYDDFGYEKDTFPAPQEQLASYKKDLHLRMGGIRKPRLGNTGLIKFAKTRGWIFPGGNGGYANQRCMNYSIPEARDWYAQQQKHYYADGVSFFWNDEGETDFFTFYWWNVAQIESLRMNKAFQNIRFFSINRAWSPGMARLGAAVWTGDVNPSWEDLQGTPGMVLNWGLGGAPYVTCDIGGFAGESNGQLLTRWMQLGAFLPIMRVHSILTATPHFPWLWNGYESLLRDALNLRYQLLPYHYSLAVKMYKTKTLMMRPLAAEFPEDNTAADLTSQYLDGDLLVAAVLRQDNEKEIYLPDGTWYNFNSSTSTKGPSQISGTAAMNETPVFVRPGSIITLAPVIQYSDALPGGALEVQIYEGADGKFVLYEDDGETMAYTTGAVRETTFRWCEKNRTMSWNVANSEIAPNTAFKQLFVKAFSSSGIMKTDVKAIGLEGTVSLSTHVLV